MSNKFTLPLCAAGLTMAVAGAASAGGYTPPVSDTAVVPPVVAEAPLYNWAGGYVGGFVGGVFGGDDDVGISDPSDTLLGTPGSLGLSGAVYGLQAGYRWQRQVQGRTIVFGPELSYAWSNASDSFDNGGTSASTEMNDFYALRFKTGVLNAAQTTMFYGSLGYGRGDFDYEVSGLGMDYNGSYGDDAWLVGLGLEHKMTERMSLFGEWEYLGFGKETLTDGAGYSTEATPRQSTLKVGVNFSF